MKVLLPLLFLCAGPLAAEQGTPPPNHVVEKAVSWMQSRDPEKRKAAFRSVHLLGEDALPAFESALRKARLHHEKALGEFLNNGDTNPIREAAGLLEDLTTERARVLQLIRTDYQKDPGKIRMLTDEMETLTRSWKRLAKLAEEDPAPIESTVDAFAHALADLTAELTRFTDPASDPGEEPLAARKEDALRNSFEGELYLKNRALFEGLRRDLARLAETEHHNEGLAWTSGYHTDFATHLNHQRAVIGLAPLTLNENLSQAAAEHSEDMKRLGFFAHDSPVEGKKTPAMRARKAGYKGGFRGENIALGYPNSRAAYEGWFGSDGHRFIMFARGPDECGLGRAGSHWTLMTGE